MSEIRDRIIDGIVAREGGYSNNPADSGGETNHGITKAVALSYGYTGSMEAMTRRDAFDIYSYLYWHRVRGDQLAALSELVVEEVADTAVNMGVGRAGEFLQRALNVFNRRQSLYPDIAVDGAIGSKTVGALEAYLSTRDEKILARALNCLQGSSYIELAESRAKDEAFIYGWLKNRVVI